MKDECHHLVGRFAVTLVWEVSVSAGMMDERDLLVGRVAQIPCQQH
jgi:hypothetical protein